MDMSRDREDSVKLAVAENPNTPQDVLIHLAYSRNDNIREALIYNESSPKEVFYILSKDKRTRIRLAWLNWHPVCHRRR